MSNLEEKIEKGRAILDMLQQDGWKILEQRLKEEINKEIDELKDIELEKKGLQEIAAEYIIHRERLNGLKKVEEIIEEILTDKKNAENLLKK